MSTAGRIAVTDATISHLKCVLIHWISQGRIRWNQQVRKQKPGSHTFHWVYCNVQVQRATECDGGITDAHQSAVARNSISRRCSCFLWGYLHQHSSFNLSHHFWNFCLILSRKQSAKTTLVHIELQDKHQSKHADMQIEWEWIQTPVTPVPKHFLCVIHHQLSVWYGDVSWLQVNHRGNLAVNV